jgi:hypothetical protein
MKLMMQLEIKAKAQKENLKGMEKSRTTEFGTHRVLKLANS